MGCCLSRASGPNSPYPGGIPNGSARHISPPPLTLPESAHQGAMGSRVADQSQPQERRDRLTEHINKPLSLHSWSSVGRKWTRDDLKRERIAYFDTRVTGRAEIWQALHATLEILWSDEDSSIEDLNGLQTAQSILTAAEISLPTGNLANGAYDSLGNYYPLPDWVVSAPQNVVDLRGEEEVEGTKIAAEKGSNDECESIASSKGKHTPIQVDRCRVFARLSETGRDVSITFTKTDTVKFLAAKIAKQEKLGPGKRLRLAYMGKMLNEKGNLEEQGWVQGHIINALVFER